MEQPIIITVTGPPESPVTQKYSLKTLPSSTSARILKIRSREEMSTMSLDRLQNLYRELSTTVQEVSSELVTLLQDRHSLQEEVDLRLITIEQLLKFAERRQVQLGEPLAVQMSIIRSAEDTKNCLG